MLSHGHTGGPGAEAAPRAVAPGSAVEGPQLATKPVGSVIAHGARAGADGAVSTVSWQLPQEVPVALLLNSVPYTVMMATPANLADFGRGFVLAEGIVGRADDIHGVLVLPAETGSDVTQGLAVDIAVDEAALAAKPAARRSLEGRSGCGLCGIEDIGKVVREPGRLARDWVPETGVVLKAFGALAGQQPMNQVNRSVHGAAWVSKAGEIMLVREDVGRHNALDKLIGALAREGTDVTTGFVLMTSRCSFELVQKAATVGITALVTISAPTSLALELAKAYGLFLASLDLSKRGGGGVVVFNS